MLRRTPSRADGPAAGALRVLVADAWPAGRRPNRLDARATKAAVAGLVRTGAVEPSLLAGATRERLERALDEAPLPFDVLHFVGQGLYDESPAIRALLLESADGLDELPVDTLLDLGRRYRLETLLLTVDGASGTRQPDRERFTGDVTDGSPALIDVALGEADVAATRFLHALYRALAERLPAPQALHEAATSASGERRSRRLRPHFLPHLSRTLAAAVGALAVVGTLVGLYADLPWFHHPKQARMQGVFNLAVADFDDPDARLATRVANNLRTALPDAKVWGPELTHAVQDAPAAEKRAAQINADVLVYGRVGAHDGNVELWPKFYVRPETSLYDDSFPSVDAAGQYFLGPKISKVGGLDNGATIRDLGNALGQRAQAVTNFFVGLSEYAAENLNQADKRFAIAERAWTFNGRELVYLFRGNTALQKAAATGDITVPARAQLPPPTKLLQRASRFYARARRANPSYARAYIGLGEARFQLARGSCDPPASTDGLRRARAAFGRASKAQEQPPFADILAKSEYGLGRVALCLSQARIEPSWQEAEQHLRHVVDLYERKNDRLKGLAAEAHADLGLVYLPEVRSSKDALARYRHADAEYAAAVRLTDRRDRKGIFLSQRKFIAEQVECLKQPKAPLCGP